MHVYEDWSSTYELGGLRYWKLTIRMYMMQRVEKRSRFLRGDNKGYDNAAVYLKK